MQYEQPEDFIFASGKLHSIADVLNTAFGLFHWIGGNLSKLMKDYSDQRIL